MGFIQTIRSWFKMIFGGKARAEFDVKDMTSKEMEAFISKCMDIYKGEPEWKKGNIETINVE